MKRDQLKQQLSLENLEAMFGLFENIISEYVQYFSTLIEYANTPIQSEQEVLERAQVMDELADMATGHHDIVMVFVNAIADRIEEYEETHLEIPKPTPSEVLAELMKIKGVKQKDLGEIAPQSVISELLNNKREMNLEHIKGFSGFFNVPVTMFIH